MRPPRSRVVPFLVALAPLLPSQDDVPDLVVHGDRAAHRVPATLHGICLEELHHAGEGGLHAELLRNRAFEEPPGADGLPPGWALELDTDARAQFARDGERPHDKAAPHALRLRIDTGAAAVVNAGHFGVPLREGATYTLRLDVRRDEVLPARMVASLTSAGGEVYTELDIRGIGTDWQRYELRLESPVTDPDARFAITVWGPGTLWLDTVSLCPLDTWQLRPNGLRRDLMEMLRALRPGFVRLPGGSGDLRAGAFRWSATIGDIAARPGHADAARGYWSTDGLGLHEYLQLCEDLRAEPVFVARCGTGGGAEAPLDGLQPWIDEALAAMEYANGPTSSPWGSLRARAGHPEPFRLTHVRIGDAIGAVDGSGGTLAGYAERCERLRAAIAAQWPDAATIAGVRGRHPVQIVDEHVRGSGAEFWSGMDRYAGRDRSGPKVCIGRHAVSSEAGAAGGLRAALAEAAFLCGLERSSDHVVMASHAPLLAHVRDRALGPDLIVFDGLRACGTAAYWAQVLFARHRIDRLLPVDCPPFAGPVVGGPAPTPTFTAVAGRVEGTGEIVLKVVNGADQPRRVRLRLPGCGALQATADVLVLTGAMDDENTLDDPERVALRASTVDTADAEFEHEFAARSLTGLRLRPAR